MSRRDYERAQQAIQRGQARPLREVLTRVQASHPGTVIRVGFSSDGGSFRVLTVNNSGAVVSVRVDAASGRITGAQAC
ncbi:PepSY domain-containing protein [Thalassorhabdomicrobium marinisediminis]|uniref:PepSY domain-containing protein n=1 Tax=Thalassorhabdomicrobium marinisediminis TaxID=2170577 RepID=A0A2T7G134_9RHOB|nr:PepSY domain-containing protein [Thalassorhabdomicrobium marinisediminis]PVA08143.1 hypothetical protein DC363_01200 [Thalassorhabdomicrobium marinisediminis]